VPVTCYTPPMTRFDAVLFDLDGTLLDSVPLILSSYRHVFTEHGLPPRTDAEVLAGLGTPLEAMFERWVDDPALVQTLADAYIEHNLAVHDGLVRPFPGVSELVRDLHVAGIPMAIVTSKRRRGTEMGLAALGLADCFSVVVTADDVSRPKPDPEPVQQALEALGVPAASAVFVGDATHDVHAGRAAEVVTIAVTWGAASEAQLVESGPTHLVRDVGALRGILLPSVPSLPDIK